MPVFEGEALFEGGEVLGERGAGGRCESCVVDDAAPVALGVHLVESEELVFGRHVGERDDQLVAIVFGQGSECIAEGGCLIGASICEASLCFRGEPGKDG